MSRSHRSHRSAKLRWSLDRKSHQCDRKERFPDEAAAQDRIDGLRRAGKAQETMTWVLRPYACPRCLAWHVGHGDV